MATSTTTAADRIDAHEIEHEGPDFYQGSAVILMDEIELGERFTVALRLLYTTVDRQRAMLADPVSVFSQFQYGRTIDTHNEVVLRPCRSMDELPVRNDDILTPAHPAWDRFLARVKENTLDPKYPVRCNRNGYEDTAWGAALALFDMGFAVAESLAYFSAFTEADDDGIRYELRDAWQRAKRSAQAARRAQVRSRRRAK